MAKFLNTSATNFYLEELIKNAKERLILISPFLKLNDRIKELLEDKNRLKIDISYEELSLLIDALCDKLTQEGKINTHKEVI